MYHKVLIISSAEGFIVKGLETKLTGVGIASLFSTYKISDLEGKFENTDLIIMFTDDTVTLYSEAYSFIKKQCDKNDLEIAVVGTKEEYDVLNSHISDGYIYKMFERPIDMEALIEDISKYKRDDAAVKNRNILIDEDDVSYITMIMDWLKDRYHVSLANSGEQALTWLKKNKADLILLDYEMPKTSGPQVLEMIRSDKKIADTPVMFLTGQSEKESIMKVVALKPVGYQLKSVDRATLRKNIEKFFSKKK